MNLKTANSLFMPSFSSMRSVSYDCTYLGLIFTWNRQESLRF